MVILIIQHSNSEVSTKQHVKHSALKISDPLRNSNLLKIQILPNSPLVPTYQSKCEYHILYQESKNQK